MPLTYSLGADAPAGMTIDSQTGLLTWAGSSVQMPGTVSFTVTVEDDGTPQLSASETITIDVKPVKPPVVSEIPNQDIMAGETLNLNLSLSAFDPNQPPFPLTFSLGAWCAGRSLDHARRLAELGHPSGPAVRRIHDPGGRRR